MCPSPETKNSVLSPGLNIYNDDMEKENSQNRCFNRKYPVIHSALSSDQITYFKSQINFLLLQNIDSLSGIGASSEIQ